MLNKKIFGTLFSIKKITINFVVRRPFLLKNGDGVQKRVSSENTDFFKKLLEKYLKLYFP